MKTYAIHPIKKHGKTSWLNTHAPILRVIFAKRSDQWTTKCAERSERADSAQRREHAVKRPSAASLDYSDIDRLSKIKNKFRVRSGPIHTKSFLAHLVKGTDIRYPATAVIRNGVIEYTSERAKQLYQSNANGKYYLKIDGGCAGKGIELFRTPRDAHNHVIVIRSRKAHTYVLQESVDDLLLYEGTRKFEFRIWVLFHWADTGTRSADGSTPSIDVYFYHDAVMRLSSVPYDAQSMKREGNITTSALYYGDSAYKSDLLSRQAYFNDVFPQAIASSQAVARLLKAHIAPVGKNGFEIMGFDFLVTNDRRVVLIEINRNIGYYTWPKGIHAPHVNDLNIQMISDLVDVAIAPIDKETGWRYKITL